MRSHKLLSKVKNLNLLLSKGVIVEIGSARESLINSSTEYFHNISKEYKVDFYSIDFSEYCYNLAKSLIGDKAILGKGEDKIKEIKEKISVLYLDNFDIIDPKIIGHEESLKSRIKKYGDGYRKHNVSINPNNISSQQAHLLQAQAALPKLSSSAVVIFDDTPFSNNTFSGKGGLAVPWLKSQGFKILYTQSSGILLSKKHETILATNTLNSYN